MQVQIDSKHRTGYNDVHLIVAAAKWYEVAIFLSYLPRDGHIRAGKNEPAIP